MSKTQREWNTSAAAKLQRPSTRKSNFLKIWDGYVIAATIQFVMGFASLGFLSMFFYGYIPLVDLCAYLFFRWNVFTLKAVYMFLSAAWNMQKYPPLLSSVSSKYNFDVSSNNKVSNDENVIRVILTLDFFM